MGEGMFSSIVKGPVHRAVDAHLNSGAGPRADFLAKLRRARNADEYVTLLQSIGVKDPDANYLRTWWYNVGPDGFWPGLQPIFPELKAGLIQAIEVANIAPALPIDSYWSIGGTQVKVFITRSQYQVNRIILTPPTDAPTRARTQDADVWVVERGSASLTRGYSRPPARDQVVEAVEVDPARPGHPVVTWRVRDLP